LTCETSRRYIPLDGDSIKQEYTSETPDVTGGSMKVHVNVEEDDGVHQTLEYDLVPTEPIETLAAKVAADLDEPIADILADFGSNGSAVAADTPALDVLHGCVKVQRVCVELHFETETITHRFSPKAQWERVHLFGCKKFKVAEDACANLELHDGTVDGPALNERQAIGSFKGCRTIWLVKPGPEPNGSRR
jgi:hypothetical protein